MYMNSFKVLCLAAAVLLPAMALAQPKATRVSGHIDGLGNDSIYINMDDMNLDSPRTKGAYPTKDGSFDFTVSPEHVCSMAIMDYEKLKTGDAGDMKLVYFTLMPGEDAVISGTWENYTVKGSQFYEDCAATRAFMDDVYKGMTRDNHDSIMKIAAAKATDYIKAHPNQEAAMTLVSMFDTKGIEAVLPLFDKSVSEGRMQWYYKPILKMYESQAKRQEAAAKIVEGQEAPAFTLPDLDGKPVTLASFRGKYLVLDFWGSWCSWCIKGFPDMRAAYDKYKDKMEILGVDCNDTEEKWKRAVEKHQAVWRHVRQSKETDNVSDMYGVQGFPTKIVIDPQGKIAKVVVGEDPAFYTYLDELFNK